METTLLLIRHGESEANIQKRFAGNWDIDLTDKGYLQAKITAEYIKRTYSVDKIYSSDLKRAFYTAKAVSDLTGVQVIKEKALREISAGEWEKKTFDELARKYPETFLNAWKEDIGKAICDGGESVVHVGERVYNFLLKVAKENQGKTVVVATHATPIRTALCLMQEKDIAKAKAKDMVWASNASVTEVKYKDGKWEIVDFSHDKHLSDAKTSLPPNV